MDLALKIGTSAFFFKFGSIQLHDRIHTICLTASYNSSLPDSVSRSHTTQFVTDRTDDSSERIKFQAIQRFLNISSLSFIFAEHMLL